MSNSNNVYSIVTEKIIDLLEKGVVPWKKPWKGGKAGMPKNLVSKKAYRGVNIFLLSVYEYLSGFDSPWWLTYKQAKDLGGYVRKGQTGALVVFYKPWEKETTDDTGKIITETIPVLRYYKVFNSCQCESIEYPGKADPSDDLEFSPIAQCETIVSGMPNPPEIQHSDQRRAYYSPLSDMVHIPNQRHFSSIPEYYSTLFHELTHSTKHESRLNRKDSDEKKIAAFGSAEYSKEELIAEMGAAFLCGLCDIETAIIENSAAYIQGWLKRLRDDKKLVVQAAAQAQKAADYIQGKIDDKGGDS